MRLKKNNVYIVRVSEESRALLEDLKIIDGAFTFTRNIAEEFNKKAAAAVHT